MDDAVHATRGLLAALCELAADADPERVSIGLAALPAGDLAESDGDADAVALADLPETTPVFAEFYFPDAGRSLRNVFGVDLSTPAGQTHGRLVSHPDGRREPTVEDDFHAVVLVAVPPWDVGEVRAFDRGGRRLELRVVAASAPDPEFETA
ncbi:MAG: hypothetical protein ABEJ04_07335 [Halobacteriaceae archaeon]